MLFAVVLFIESEDLSAVPSNWLNITQDCCRWPPFQDGVKISRAIKKRLEPSDAWNSYSARVMYHTNDLAVAFKKAKEAEGTSDLQTDGEIGVRKRKKPKQYEESSDSDGFILPTSLHRKKKKPLINHVSQSAGSSVSKADGSQNIVSQPSGNERIEEKMADECESDQTDIVDVVPASMCSSQLQRQNALPMNPRNTVLNEDTTHVVILAISRLEAKVDSLLQILADVATKQNNLEVRLIQFTEQAFRSTIEGEDLIKDSLPVQDQDGFIKLENMIFENEVFSKQLEQRLARVGGTTVKHAVKGMIEYCMNNTVQRTFNWEGKSPHNIATESKKKAFKNTQLCRVIQRVVNSLHVCDDAEIGKSILNYLRNAADRCGGRKKRKGGIINEETDERDVM